MMSREECFEKLEILVLDENRIVTYKGLSRELKIHVNKAKEYLSDFLVTQKTKEKTSLHATYFLAGVEEKDGVKSLKVLVVSQRKLEEAKEKLSEVTSCHIYSVSRGVADECSLYGANYPYNKNAQDSNKYSSIKPPTIEIRAPILNRNNVEKNDSKTTTLKKQEVGTSKNGVSSHGQKTNTNERPSTSTASVTEQVESIDIKKLEINENTQVKKSNSELKKEKPNSLASLWQKNEEKSKALKTETSKSNGKGKSKSPQETKKTPANNILSMFSKQAAKNAGNGSKKETVHDSVSIKKEVPPKEKVEIATRAPKSETLIPERKPSNSNNKKRKAGKKQTKSSSKQHNKSDSDDEFQPKKRKHRRITAFEDSDSNSECEDLEAQDRAQRSLLLPEEPIECDMTNVTATPVSDDSEDPIPPTPPVFTHKGKKKICKTVSKTFMDEDGFMVTKEVKEMLSEPESDEDPLPPKSSTSKEVPKPNQFSYRKQASLTSFFKQS